MKGQKKINTQINFFVGQVIYHTFNLFIYLLQNILKYYKIEKGDNDKIE